MGHQRLQILHQVTRAVTHSTRRENEAALLVRVFHLAMSVLVLHTYFLLHDRLGSLRVRCLHRNLLLTLLHWREWGESERGDGNRGYFASDKASQRKVRFGVIWTSNDSGHKGTTLV